MIKLIGEMAGKYSSYEIFSDWIRCMALAISNTTNLIKDQVWREREQAYLDTMRKYTPEEREKLAVLTGCLIDTLEDGPDDVLGDIYMKANMGSKAAGQFFTPFHLSEVCARVGLIGMIEEYKEEKLDRITISEPACGGGAMILAAAKVIHESGINYQTAMEVVAQDIDWKGVYMCYVQLSLLGISAICVQGSTLEEPYDPARTERSHILRTPRKAGLLV